MTFEQIKKSTETVLPVYQVAEAIGISAERIMAQARKGKNALGFPVIVACDTVRIPRLPLIKFLEGTMIYADAGSCTAAEEEDEIDELPALYVEDFKMGDMRVAAERPKNIRRG